MKTSNKLLLAVGLVILACLVGYNFALKKEYDKGDFRSPYYGMHKLNLSGFKIIHNQAADVMGIKIKHSPVSQVWVNPYVEAMLKITSDGRTLNIETLKRQQRNVSYTDVIVITCPEVDSLVTDGQPNEENQQSIDNHNTYLHTKIEGFTQPTLGVSANNRTLIIMDNNRLGRLNLNLGDSKGGRGYLTMLGSNKIDVADFNVKGKSELKLYGRSVAQSNNHIAESASVSLSDGALPLFLRAQNTPQ
jgi:hypothetical protein